MKSNSVTGDECALLEAGGSSGWEADAVAGCMGEGAAVEEPGVGEEPFTLDVDGFAENVVFSPVARNMPPPPARTGGLEVCFVSGGNPVSSFRFERVRVETGVRLSLVGCSTLGVCAASC